MSSIRIHGNHSCRLSGVIRCGPEGVCCERCRQLVMGSVSRLKDGGPSWLRTADILSAPAAGCQPSPSGGGRAPSCVGTGPGLIRPTGLSGKGSRHSIESSRHSRESSTLSDESSRLSRESSTLSDESSRLSRESSTLSDESSRLSRESLTLSDESSRLSRESSGLSGKSSGLSRGSSTLSGESSGFSGESLTGSDGSSRRSSESSRHSGESLPGPVAALDLDLHALPYSFFSFPRAAWERRSSAPRRNPGMLGFASSSQPTP